MSAGQQLREARLTDYLEGQLAEADLEALLEDEPGLREALAEADAGRGLLQELPSHAVPPNFLRKVQRRVRRRSGGRFFNPAPYPTRFGPAVEVFVVIAVVTMAAFYMVMETGRAGPGQLVEVPVLAAPAEGQPDDAGPADGAQSPAPNPPSPTAPVTP